MACTGPCLVRSWAATSFRRVRRNQTWSRVLVFFDISAAFYSVVREIVTGAKAADFDPRVVAKGLQLSDDDLQSMASAALSDPVLNADCSSELLRRVAADLHPSTWFTLAGDEQIVQTVRGTPGSSWADLVFGVCLRGSSSPAVSAPRMLTEISCPTSLGTDSETSCFCMPLKARSHCEQTRLLLRSTWPSVQLLLRAQRYYGQLVVLLPMFWFSWL